MGVTTKEELETELRLTMLGSSNEQVPNEKKRFSTMGPDILDTLINNNFPSSHRGSST
jgi:hypothetical protein